MATPSVISTPKTSSKPPQSTHVSKVRVVVRVRPFLPSEILKKSGNPFSCASILNPELGSSDEVAVCIKDQTTSRKECYKLDSFYGQDSSVTQIFQNEIKPLIPGIFDGCNATVFAYGATGSGKTYTMQGNDQLPGLMPLAMSTILSLCRSSESLVEISYYEVYMDRCYDLLEPKAQEISVLDDKDGQVQLRGLSRVCVSSMPEFYQAFSLGIQRRKVSHTGLNDVSSRSHGVLVIAVSTRSSDGSMPVVTGKLNLIDLAGNEDNRRTCNEGIRLQESAKINQSLFALSNVIYALNNNKARVPYRESKLTRILQDSLGGNSHALMVACLNPGEYQESVNTVNVASRSRQITNYTSSAQKEETQKVKIDMEAKLCAWLESKGKIKGAQRSGTAYGSPIMGKTQLSTKSIQKKNVCSTSAKPKSTIVHSLAYPEAARNLFNAGAVVVHPEENTCPVVKEQKDCFAVLEEDGTEVSEERSFTDNKDSPFCVEDQFISQDGGVKEHEDHYNISEEDGAQVSKDQNSIDCKSTPFAVEDQFTSQDNGVEDQFLLQDVGCESYKNHREMVSHPGEVDEDSDVEDQFVSQDAGDDCCKNQLEVVTFPGEKDLLNSHHKNGFDDAEHGEEDKTTLLVKKSNKEKMACSISKYSVASPAKTEKMPTNLSDEVGRTKEYQTTTGMDTILHSVTSLIDESPHMVKKISDVSKSSVESPMRVLQQSLRRVLSPINTNSNMRVFEDLPSKDQICLVLFEQKTPKKPYVLTCDSEGFSKSSTPFDKFNSQSSNLKSSLVQEYLTFLNSASKEELIRLKGIGKKRAESIVHLREAAPINSLYDLEKIGLSTKQVNDIFRREAHGIFD